MKERLGNIFIVLSWILLLIGFAWLRYINNKEEVNVEPNYKTFENVDSVNMIGVD